MRLIKLTLEIEKRHENQPRQAREENHIDIVVVEYQPKML